VKVTLLFFDGCPNWQLTDARLTRLADDLGFELERCQVETDEDAQRLQFRGSPTVLIDGREVFATGDEPIGLSCRMYQTDHGLAGAPTVEQLHDVLTAANP
jgi:hypothetical protein